MRCHMCRDYDLCILGTGSLRFSFGRRPLRPNGAQSRFDHRRVGKRIRFYARGDGLFDVAAVAIRCPWEPLGAQFHHRSVSCVHSAGPNSTSHALVLTKNVTVI